MEAKAYRSGQVWVTALSRVASWRGRIWAEAAQLRDRYSQEEVSRGHAECPFGEGGRGERLDCF